MMLLLLERLRLERIVGGRSVLLLLLLVMLLLLGLAGVGMEAGASVALVDFGLFLPLLLLLEVMQAWSTRTVGRCGQRLLLLLLLMMMLLLLYLVEVTVGVGEKSGVR